MKPITNAIRTDVTVLHLCDQVDAFADEYLNAMGTEERQRVLTGFLGFRDALVESQYAHGATLRFKHMIQGLA